MRNSLKPSMGAEGLMLKNHRRRLAYRSVRQQGNHFYKFLMSGVACPDQERHHLLEWCKEYLLIENVDSAKHTFGSSNLEQQGTTVPRCR